MQNLHYKDTYLLICFITITLTETLQISLLGVYSLPIELQDKANL